MSEFAAVTDPKLELEGMIRDLRAFNRKRVTWEEGVPYEILFRDWWADRLKAKEELRRLGKPVTDSQDQQSLKMVNIGQVVDQELIDNVMAYLERQKRGQ